MTNQEAKTLVREHREFVAFPPVIQGTVWRQKLIEALDLAIESLERADKYRWHDLRKNPEDLPKHEGYYLCKCGTGSWEYRVMFYEVINGYNKEADRWRDREIGMVFNHFIIAWREIEPFEEVEE